MIGLNSYNYQQMSAAAASSGGISFGSGQSQYTPQSSEETNIFAVDGNSSSVNGVSGISTGSQNGINSTSKAENTDLVGRLDRLDASTIRPEAQDEQRANYLDLYA